MRFVPYVKFDSGDDIHLFPLDSALPSSLAPQKEMLLSLLPTVPGELQAADVEKLVSKCGEIVEILEGQEDPDSFEYASPYDELSAFLEEVTQARMVCRDEPQTLDQLIECACEGGLEDEWIRQFVSKNSELYRSNLEKLLDGSLDAENCFAIIRLLLLCFPREKVERSIEIFMQQTEDVDLKEQAAFLLMVFDNEYD